MSALLTQLQSILKTWDDIQPLPNEHDKTEDPFLVISGANTNSGPIEGDPLHNGAHAGDSILDEGRTHLPPIPMLATNKVSGLLEKGNNSFSPYYNSRQVLSRLELARAALALFASNAGAYRPILTNLLKYVFECMDFLIDNQVPLTHATSTADADAATSAVSISGGLEIGISKAEDVIASAHQKVQLVESRMSVLVEESTAQRDRFKAQLLAQQKTQVRLEHLLQKQVELNHMLTSHSVNPHEEEESASKQAETTGATSRRRATYAQQLIARAEKESTIMELDAQVGQLTLERDDLQEKLMSLKDLNTKYARQAIELSARLNILKNHNIALASDAVLYQHDATREKQKSQKLQRDLMVARNIILVLLEVRRHEMFFGFSNSVSSTSTTKREKNPEIVDNRGSMEDAPQFGSNNTLESSRLLAFPERHMRGSYCQKEERCDTSDPVSLSGTLPANFDVLACTNEDVLTAVQDDILRKQLQDIMSINDASNGGAAKGALLKLLNLQCSSLTGGDKPQTGKQVPMLKDVRSHLWVPPYGRNSNVPFHLCSRDCVMLIPFHPLVAECFVHELLSQRLEFFEFYGRSAQTLGTASKGNHLTVTDGVPHFRDLGKGSSSAKTSAESNFCLSTPTPMTVSLDEFIVLFINMIWLNKSAVVGLEGAAPPRPGSKAAKSPTAGALAFFHRYTSTQGPSSPSPSSPSPLRSSSSGQLTVEGLKLAYGLDVASRRQDCSSLTYAYGLASRRELAELVFSVLRQERAVFLSLCTALERERVAPRKGGGARAKGRGAGALPGWVPTPQLARVLLCMFPAYPVARVEQMVAAAVEDGADPLQAPHAVCYTVLLPERLLPGAVASGAAVELSAFWSEGRFATLFYKSICDDALESMQLLEDAMHSFGDSLTMQKRRVGLVDAFRNSANASGTDLFVSVEQLTTFGLKVLPTAERQRWGPALNSVFTRYPLLRPAPIAPPAGPLFDDEAHDSESESAAASPPLQTYSEQEVAQKPSSSSRKSARSVSAFTNEADYVKLADVVRYLRCHVILRRGLYTNYVDAAQSTQDTQGTLDPGGEAFHPMWTEAQLKYINTLQDTWNHYVLASEPALTVDAEFFWKLLLEADPHRARIWATPSLSYGSPFLRHEGELRCHKDD